MAVTYIYLVDDLVKRVNFALFGTTTIDSVYDTDIRWALELAMVEWAVETRPQDLTTTGTITTADGTSEYSLPDDFWELRPAGVRINASPWYTLQPIPKPTFQRYELDGTGTTGTPTHYVLLSRSSSTAEFKIRLYPTPNAILSIKVDYVALPAKIRDTVAGDGTYIDKRLPPALIGALPSRAAMSFAHLLDSAQLNACAARWADAMRISKDTAVKQGGAQIIPEPMSDAFDFGPRAPGTLT